MISSADKDGPSPSPSSSGTGKEGEGQKGENDRNQKREKRKAKKAAAIQRRNLRLANRPSPTTNFPGRHKWLGGAVDEETGKIYGVPSHSHHIFCLTPEKEEEKASIQLIDLPNQYKAGSFKWLRGVITEGHLYGIPAWNVNGVLKMRLKEKSQGGRGPRVKLLPLPHPPEYYVNDVGMNDLPRRRIKGQKSVDRSRWMWHGGALEKDSSGDASIYCIPSNADHVLKVNTVTEEVKEIGEAFKGQNKWYGGIKGFDGCIYGMPYTAKGVIRIDPRTDNVEVIGDYPVGKYKWHGGLIAKSTGVIYAFPAHSNEVLCVDTNTNSNLNDSGDQSWRVSTIPIKIDENDTNTVDELQYKWLGGAYGADDCIYGMPSDATSILRIDPIKNEARTFGKVSDKKNKWQGGVLSTDKCIYAVPADMDCVLKIDTDPNTPLKIEMIGDLGDSEDKWQGGFQADDGNIYGIPENICSVMKLTPGIDPKVELLS